MLRYIKAIVLLFCLYYKVQAQTKFGNEWIVGFQGYQIKFIGNVILYDSILFPSGPGYFGLGHSNICDSAGNVILTSDGMDIMDSMGNFIDQGDTLSTKEFYAFSSGWSLYPQTSLILPLSNNQYYLVTPSCNDTMLNNNWLNSLNAGFNMLYFHLIDMNANGGAGKVIKRMQPILENRFMDKTLMAACRHANGKDWWLLKRSGIMGGDSNFFYTIRFTQDSVYNEGIQLIPFPRNENFLFDAFGQLKFNEQGTRIAFTQDNALSELFIADFDRCTGQLSNYKKIQVPVIGGDGNTMGLSFSPNGRFIYVSSSTHILQYDSDEPIPVFAWYDVYGMDTTATQFMGYTSLQLAPNGRIYIGHHDGFSRQMSSIDNPDNKGAACNFCRKCLRTNSYYGYIISPPEMPNYELGADTTKACWPLSASESGEPKSVDWEMYPNPACNKIVFKNAEGLGKTLFNTLGQLLCSIQGNEMDIHTLQPGLYFLRCNGISKKIIVE